MDESIVVDYLKTIKKNTKTLLSINSERASEYGEYGKMRKHIVVQDIVAKVGGLKLSYRFPSWFFRGYYVEELYSTQR